MADSDIQGDVYAKIIEEVVTASAGDFEESGVGTTTLSELQQVRTSVCRSQSLWRRSIPSSMHIRSQLPPSSPHEDAQCRKR